MKTLNLRYFGLDDFNRPIFKNIEKKEYYGSTDTVFSFCDSRETIINYFQNNKHELCYFGKMFNCEPMGDPIKETVKINIEK